jgi:hypothetical protein
VPEAATVVTDVSESVRPLPDPITLVEMFVKVGDLLIISDKVPGTCGRPVSKFLDIDPSFKAIPSALVRSSSSFTYFIEVANETFDETDPETVTTCDVIVFDNDSIVVVDSEKPTVSVSAPTSTMCAKEESVLTDSIGGPDEKSSGITLWEGPFFTSFIPTVFFLVDGRLIVVVDSTEWGGGDVIVVYSKEWDEIGLLVVDSTELVGRAFVGEDSTERIGRDFEVVDSIEWDESIVVAFVVVDSTKIVRRAIVVVDSTELDGRGFVIVDSIEWDGGLMVDSTEWGGKDLVVVDST